MSTELTFATKRVYGKNYSIQNHTHPCYELVYYLEGEGVTTVGDEVYNFSPNTFILAAPNQIHKESSEGSVTVKFIGFSTDSGDLKPGIYSDTNKKVIETIDEILKEIQNQQPQYQTMLNLLAKKIVILILRFSPESYYSKTSFEYIENYIKMNANRNTTIQQLAKDLNYNYDYLRQLFLSKLKISAKKYFFNFKLQNAKNYLLNSNLTVNQIADITGFSSASHLCSTFRKAFGVTPKQFRDRDPHYYSNKFSVVHEDDKTPPEEE